jgi:flagellar biosynthesis GTPase FlhF
MPLPVAGGAIAVVGSGGSGKTRAVAAIAVAAARAGHTVTVARLGSHERQHELAELLAGEPVEVLPAMRTRATARAVASARDTGLVIVDTTSASPSDRSALEVLSETLAQFALNGVLLAVPTTFNARAAERLADGFDALAPTGMVATHADECADLGAVAELAIRRRLPLGHVHAGLDVTTAVQTLDPARLAGQLL